MRTKIILLLLLAAAVLVTATTGTLSSYTARSGFDISIDATPMESGLLIEQAEEAALENSTIPGPSDETGASEDNSGTGTAPAQDGTGQSTQSTQQTEQTGQTEQAQQTEQSIEQTGPTEETVRESGSIPAPADGAGTSEPGSDAGTAPAQDGTGQPARQAE